MADPELGFGKRVRTQTKPFQATETPSRRVRKGTRGKIKRRSRTYGKTRERQKQDPNVSSEEDEEFLPSSDEDASVPPLLLSDSDDEKNMPLPSGSDTEDEAKVGDFDEIQPTYAGKQKRAAATATNKIFSNEVRESLGHAIKPDEYAENIRLWDTHVLPGNLHNDKKDETQDKKDEVKPPHVTLDALTLKTWTLELISGFNIAVYGVGSKRHLLNDMAERVQQFVVGSSFVIHYAYDAESHFESVIQGIENAVSPVKLEESNGSHNGGSYVRGAQSLNGSSQASTSHGHLPVSSNAPSYQNLQSRLESAMTIANQERKALFVYIHGLDALASRQPQALDLLAMLGSQEMVHVVMSFDHMQTPSLIPSQLAWRRPSLGLMAGDEHGMTRNPGLSLIFHQVDTFEPYTEEALRSGTVASIIPYSAMLPSKRGEAEMVKGRGSEEILESLLHIVESVPPRSLAAIRIVALCQIGNYAMLTKDERRSVDAGLAWTEPPRTKTQAANRVAPFVASPCTIIYQRALEELVAYEEKVVDGLLGEFRVHNVLLFADRRASSAAAKARSEQGRYAWLPIVMKDLAHFVRVCHFE